jgi:hypothetical protein
MGRRKKKKTDRKTALRRYTEGFARRAAHRKLTDIGDITAHFCAFIEDFPLPVTAGGHTLTAEELGHYKDCKHTITDDIAWLYLSFAYHSDRPSLVRKAVQFQRYWNGLWREAEKKEEKA